MCQCFEGEQVDWENLRTPEQKNMMAQLYGPILTGMQMGATQFPGQLSAPMTDMQKMAAKTMSGIGGYGWEQQSPKYKPVPELDIASILWGGDNASNREGGGSGQGTNGKGGTVSGGTKQKGGILPPGPDIGPEPYKPDVPEALAAQIIQSMFNYDPRNTRQG